MGLSEDLGTPIVGPISSSPKIDRLTLDQVLRTLFYALMGPGLLFALVYPFAGNSLYARTGFFMAGAAAGVEMVREKRWTALGLLVLAFQAHLAAVYGEEHLKSFSSLVSTILALASLICWGFPALLEWLDRDTNYYGRD